MIDARHQFGDEEVEVGIALAVGRRGRGGQRERQRQCMAESHRMVSIFRSKMRSAIQINAISATSNDPPVIRKRR